MQIKTYLLAVILLSLSLQAFAATDQADFYVSPSGSDNNPGTLEKPFATLQKARDAVRPKLASMDKDIIVMLMDGQYILNDTVTFSLEDSGQNGHNVIYRNFPGQEPVLTSDVKITGWNKLKTDLPGLSKKAKDHIWQANVPAGLKVYSLYDGDKSLPRARSDSFKPQIQPDQWSWPMHGSGKKYPPEYMYTLAYPKGFVRQYENLPDVELLIVPFANWTMNILPLKSVDEKNNILTTTIPGTYELVGQMKKTCFPKGACWIENAADFLDKPGNWIYDSKAKKIYLWPMTDKPSENITAASVKQYILVQGQINYDQPSDIPAKNIVFQGLTFKHGQRHTFALDEKGMQHDWESYDTDNALLRFRGTENCAVKKCHFHDTAASAIRLDLHCQNITIENNLIENIGGTGVVLCGYGPGTKDVNKNNIVTNNKIVHVGQVYWHNPAIIIYQSGYNLVSHNLMAYTPYNALVVTGLRVFTLENKEVYKDIRESCRQIQWKQIEDFAVTDVSGLDRTAGTGNFDAYLGFLYARYNRIEFNEIHHAVQVLGDGNGIYLSGCGIKNIIRRNYLHDIYCNKDNHSSPAIRTDGCTLETPVVENIVTRVTGGGLAVKQFDNYCQNNIIVNLIDANDPRNERHQSIGGYIYLQENVKSKLNIIYHTGKSVPLLRAFENSQKAGGDYDIFYFADDPNAAQKQLQNYQKDNFEQHSIIADPLFVDLPNDNFLLKPDSPALKMGFKQLDVKEMGLTKDFPKNFLKESD